MLLTSLLVDFWLMSPCEVTDLMKGFDLSIAPDGFYPAPVQCRKLLLFHEQALVWPMQGCAGGVCMGCILL